MIICGAKRKKVGNDLAGTKKVRTFAPANEKTVP